MAIQSLKFDEVRALLLAAREHSERDWLMLLVCFWHGPRASELVDLTPNDVRDGVIIIRRGKGSRTTTHPLIRHTDKLLNERDPLFDYARFHGRNQTLFGIGRRQFHNIIERHGKTAGIPAHKRHAHALKHSIATYLLPKIGPAALQVYLGWKSGAMVLEYTKLTQEDVSASVLAAVS